MHEEQLKLATGTSPFCCNSLRAEPSVVAASKALQHFSVTREEFSILQTFRTVIGGFFFCCYCSQLKKVICFTKIRLLKHPA